MKKTKKRNELAIFEEFRLKPKEDPYEPKKYEYKKNKLGKLVKINKYGIPIKSEDAKSIKFKIKSYLRDEAIKETGHLIRSMKSQAYRFKKGELENLIKEQENKIIKKKGWKWLRMAALAQIGLFPFV